MNKRLVASGLLAIVTLVGAAGCTSAAGTASTAGGATAGPVEAASASIIDVRTPTEYAAGHLEGARNIDVNSADFPSQISALPKGAAYVVYCHSGNRSRAATAQMNQLGFSNVSDAGGIEQASSALGVPIVS